MFEWLGSGLLLLGTFALGSKKRWAWISSFFGSVILGWVFLYNPPLLILQIVFAILAVRGFLRWEPESQEDATKCNSV